MDELGPGTCTPGKQNQTQANYILGKTCALSVMEFWLTYLVSRDHYPLGEC